MFRHNDITIWSTHPYYNQGLIVVLIQQVWYTYMYINVVDNAMTVAGVIGFTMALYIILKISFWILSTDTRGGKDRC